jgi:DNA-binding IscR family transcriptional regulator
VTTGVIDPASVLVVMREIATRFARSQTTTVQQVAEHAGIPEGIVQRMVARLIERGCLHRLDQEDGAVALARPAEAITGDQLMEIAFEVVDDAGGADQPALLRRLREAQRRLAAETTLADLVSPPPGSPPVAAPVSAPDRHRR